MSEESEMKTKTDVIVEFIEVAVHTILYVRNIYPKGIFVTKKKYAIPIHMSVHPGINKYIDGCLLSLKKLLEWQTVESFSVNINNKDGEPLEKYVFDISDGDEEGPDDKFFVYIEEAFRACILKMSVAGGDMKNLPLNSEFEITLKVNNQGLVKINEVPEPGNVSWVDKNVNQVVNTNVIPIKTVKSRLFKVCSYIEEYNK